MRELPGQRGHNAVPRVKQNGCGRRRGRGMVQRMILVKMARLPKKFFICGLVDGKTTKNTRVEETWVWCGGGKKTSTWVWSGGGKKHRRRTNGPPPCQKQKITHLQKITYIERSGFLIKSLLQLFKQDINCFGLDLLPAFVNVHWFFKIRHGVGGVWFWNLVAVIQ